MVDVGQLDCCFWNDSEVDRHIVLILSIEILSSAATLFSNEIFAIITFLNNIAFMFFIAVHAETFPSPISHCNSDTATGKGFGLL
jgi:hypothetical protein